VTQEQWEALADGGLHGGVIKNAVKTATSMATGRKQILGCAHIVGALDSIEWLPQSSKLERLGIGTSSYAARYCLLTTGAPNFEGCKRLMRFNLGGSERTITALGVGA